jgi:5-formyltetrahydrofolate cyclo-ligase
MSENKSEIRKRLLDERKLRLSPEEREEKSSRIASFFINDLVMPAGVGSVGFYYPVHNEVETFSSLDFCMQSGIRCLFPRVVSNCEMAFLPIKSLDDLVKRTYGIYEPDLKKCEGRDEEVPKVLIVPGVAFDGDNYRIGYGKGYYDRYIRERKPYLTVGFAYSFQLVEGFDREEWDVKLNLLLTEKGWHGEFRNSYSGGLK